MHGQRKAFDLGAALEAYQAAPDKRVFLRAQGPCGAAVILVGLVLRHVLRELVDEDGGGAVFAELHRQREMEEGDA